MVVYDDFCWCVDSDEEMIIDFYVSEYLVEFFVVLLESFFEWLDVVNVEYLMFYDLFKCYYWQDLLQCWCFGVW